MPETQCDETRWASPIICSRRQPLSAPWLATAVLLFGMSPAIAADLSTAPERIHGTNLRLIPHQNFTPGTPIETIIGINDARLEVARQAGFNWVRVGVDMAPWVDNVSQEEQARTMSLVRGALASLAKRHLRGVFTLFVPAQKLVCDNYGYDAYLTGLLAILATLPDSTDWGIEVVNEPPTCPEAGIGVHWETMQKTLYQTVRKIKTQLIFVVTGNGWGALDGLIQLDPSMYEKDANTLFAFHYYEPFLFTHQETVFLRSDKINSYVRNLDWPYDQLNTSEALKAASASISADGALDGKAKARDRETVTAMFGDYAKRGTESYMSDRIKSVANWALMQHVPANRVLLGEFGVFRQLMGAKRNNTPEDVGSPRATAPGWLLHLRREVDQYGFGWAVWELDGGFGVICGGRPGTGKLCPEYQMVFAEEHFQVPGTTNPSLQ